MPRPVPIAGALVTAALVLVAGGCGFKSEPTGALSPAPVTVTDSGGADISFEQIPARIVSLDPGMTETLFAVGAGDMVVGRGAGEPLPGAAAHVRVVSSSRLGAIKALKPDLVIADEQDANILRPVVGVPVYVVDGDSIAGAERDQLNVSLLAGRGPQGRTLVGKVRDRIDRTSARVASLPVTKTYLDQGAYFPPGPMAKELIAAGGGHAVTVASPAELRQAAPQVYLSEAGYGATPASLRSSPATKHLPAVEHNRVHTIPTWWVTTDGPSMAAAVANLAAVLHPGASAGQ